MEQLELFPLNEWTIKEHELPAVTYANVPSYWKVGTDTMGNILSFNDGKQRWVYKLSHVES